MNINAVLALVCIGAVLGLILGIANMYLVAEEDERVEVVTDKLPGVNCGGCGYPGCAGFANALIEGEVSKVSSCMVSSQVIREEIAAYLRETPGADGKTLDVSV